MGRLSDREMLALINEGKQQVLVDSEYIHVKSGNVYIVADIVFKEDDMSLLVVYYSPYLAEVSFTRPMTEFVEKFEKVAE